MNIPIFRAKEKKTNRYIIGYEFYNHIEDEYYITHQLTGNNYKVDKSTLSIHFPDMLDIQGNKIFASLNNIGGSILTDGVYEFNLYFDGRKYRIIGNEINSEINDYEEWKDFKAIGIQE